MSELDRIDTVNENIRLISRSDGLVFGTDTYLLAAYIRGHKNDTMTDLGSGTGILSLLCAAREKAGLIYAVEVQPDFDDLCRRNTILNGFENSVIPVCADIRSFKADVKCNTVASNPPYMKTSGKRNDSDAKYIARHEVCGDIKDFCAAAARLLLHGGNFYTVYRADRMCDLICALRESGLEPKRMTTVYPDDKSQPVIFLAEAKLCASPGIFVTPPLIIYNDSDDNRREYTDDMKYIYENCAFPEKFLPVNKSKRDGKEKQ